MVIHYYNHKPDRFPICSSVRASGQEIVEMDSSADERYQERGVCLLHSDLCDEVFRQKKPVSFMKNGGILIFASSDYLIHEPICQTQTDLSSAPCYFVFGIKRKQTNGNYLSDSEWAELLKWAWDSKGATSLKELKANAPNRVLQLLWPPDHLAHINALAVLCQGYLVAYATSLTSGNQLESDVRVALNHMGWRTDLHEDNIATREQNGAVLRKVENSEWWWGIFTEESSASGDRKAKAIAAISEDVSVVFKTIPQEVTALLKMVESSFVDKPALVAKAYLTLEAKLESTS